MKAAYFNLYRAMCPGCGAPLSLEGSEAIVTCIYCGSDSKVERFLRKIEPDILPPRKPSSPGDPDKDFENWSSEQLIYGLLNEKDQGKRIAMAKALDSWPHATHETAVEIMEDAQAPLDKALSGILGKLICHDDIKLKQEVIRAGEKYGFNMKSCGLLFALSLGDEGTIKLLLDIAEYAVKNGREDYGKEALMGVQTAIGRVPDREQLKVCMEILLYRLLYVSGMVQDWILRHLRNHFDVGYTFMYGPVLFLMDDCVCEMPDLLPRLQDSLSKCRNPHDREELSERLSIIKSLKSGETKLAACKYLGYPPSDTQNEDIKMAIEILVPLFNDSFLRGVASLALKNFLWLGPEIPEPLKALFETSGRDLPECLKYDYERRS